jgi:hypothetical protein
MSGNGIGIETKKGGVRAGRNVCLDDRFLQDYKFDFVIRIGDPDASETI